MPDVAPSVAPAAASSTDVSALLGTVARTILKAIGTALVTRGAIDQGTVDGAIPMLAEMLVGAAMFGGASAWSMMRVWFARIAPQPSSPLAIASVPLPPAPPAGEAALASPPHLSPETAPMSLKTFIVEAEETALDALKSAGTILKDIVVSDSQKLVAEVKQTSLGTTALNIVSALESHDSTGAEKFEMLTAAIVPAILKLVAGGGFPALLTSVEGFAIEFGQSIFNDFKVGLAKVKAGHA